VASREKRPERKGATVQEENRKEIVQKVGAIKTDAPGEADDGGTGQVPGGPSPQGRGSWARDFLTLHGPGGGRAGSKGAGRGVPSGHPPPAKKRFLGRC